MFDAALLESRKRRRFGERKKSLPVAIGLHAAVIAALVGAAVWNTGEPPEPVIPVVFSLPSPPPAPLGTGGNRSTTTHKSEQPRPAAAAVPRIGEVPPTAQTPAVGEPDEREFEGPESDGPPGDPLGVENGTGERPRAGNETGTGDAPIRVGGDVVPPALVARVEPDYPESMRRVHREGVVILEAVITASGDVDDVRVLKSAGAVLDRAVSVYLTVTVTFGLHS